MAHDAVSMPYAFAVRPSGGVLQKIHGSSKAEATSCGLIPDHRRSGHRGRHPGAGIWALVLRQVVGSVIEVTLAWIAARRFRPPVPSHRGIGRGRRPRGRRGASRVVSSRESLQLLAMSISTIVLAVRLAGVATQLGLYSIACRHGMCALKNAPVMAGSRASLLPRAATQTRTCSRSVDHPRVACARGRFTCRSSSGDCSCAVALPPSRAAGWAR
jgi:hypothetical protein